MKQDHTELLQAEVDYKTLWDRMSVQENKYEELEEEKEEGRNADDESPSTPIIKEKRKS